METFLIIHKIFINFCFCSLVVCFPKSQTEEDPFLSPQYYSLASWCSRQSISSFHICDNIHKYVYTRPAPLSCYVWVLSPSHNNFQGMIFVSVWKQWVLHKSVIFFLNKVPSHCRLKIQFETVFALIEVGILKPV